MKAINLLGSPGTGKTTRLALMYREDLEVYGADQIRFLSFTRAAAAETLTKIDGLADIRGATTIHSLVYTLTGVAAAQVVDKARLQEFGDIMGFPMAGKDSTFSDISVGDEYLSLYSMARNRVELPIDTYNESTRPGTPQNFLFFIEGYERWKHNFGLIDFDDMLLRYLQDPPPHSYAILFVDEAQDLSPLQWAVIDELGKSVEKIVIAGDPDQAIFEWSGADPHGMEKFENRYKAERIVLDQSYRIPRSVHTVAHNVIKGTRRIEKAYRPRNHEGQVLNYGSVDHIRWDNRDTLVLYRTHHIRREVERDLIARGTPYTVESGVPGIMGTRAYRAIAAWETFQITGTVPVKSYKVIEAFGSQVVRNALSSGNLGSIINIPWNRALYLPENVVMYHKAMAGMNHTPNIRLSTIHGAKGREADRVVLLTEQTAQVVRNEMNNPDAEARVFYVGVTRAKEELDIVWGHEGYAIRT